MREDDAMDDLTELRRQLVAGLRGHDAHMDLDDAVVGFPAWAINERPPNVTYTSWHLLEHLRITQWDILAYIRDPDHVSPDWPVGYWPDPTAQADEDRFAATVAAFEADLAALEALVLDPATDLLAPIPHAPQHTILREVRLLINHNSYHLGEFAALRQVMGSWGPEHGE
jgi:hypothetical protein